MKILRQTFHIEKNKSMRRKIKKYEKKYEIEKKVWEKVWGFKELKVWENWKKVWDCRKSMRKSMRLKKKYEIKYECFFGFFSNMLKGGPRTASPKEDIWHVCKFITTNFKLTASGICFYFKISHCTFCGILWWEHAAPMTPLETPTEDK